MAPTTPKSKKQRKEELAAITDEDRLPGVIYIGHVPHGFYEKELKKYFSQFGRVLQIKLSRSKKNGKSKGYAFVKFQYAAVAKTVADTCQNYLFFNKLLKCEYKSAEDVHKDTFFSYKWKPNHKPKRLHNAPKSAAKMKLLSDRSKQKQEDKLEKLKEFGLDLKLRDLVTAPVASQVPSSESEEKTKSPKKKKKTPEENADSSKENIDTQISADTKEKVKTPKKESATLGRTKTPKKLSKTPQLEIKASKKESATPKADTKTPKKESATPKADTKTPKKESATPKSNAKTPKKESKTPETKADTSKKITDTSLHTETPKSSKKRKRSDVGIPNEESSPQSVGKTETPDSGRRQTRSKKAKK